MPQTIHIGTVLLIIAASFLIAGIVYILVKHINKHPADSGLLILILLLFLSVFMLAIVPLKTILRTFPVSNYTITSKDTFPYTKTIDYEEYKIEVDFIAVDELKNCSITENINTNSFGFRIQDNAVANGNLKVACDERKLPAKFFMESKS